MRSPEQHGWPHSWRPQLRETWQIRLQVGGLSPVSEHRIGVLDLPQRQSTSMVSEHGGQSPPWQILWHVWPHGRFFSHRLSHDGISSSQEVRGDAEIFSSEVLPHGQCETRSALLGQCGIVSSCAWHSFSQRCFPQSNCLLQGWPQSNRPVHSSNFGDPSSRVSVRTLLFSSPRRRHGISSVRWPQ